MDRVKSAFKKVTRGQNGKPKVPQENDEKSKGANAPQDKRTLKEEKGGGGTQPGGLSSKENEERKTYGQPDKSNSGIQPSDNTEPGANSPQDQRTLKEEKGGGGTQSGGLSSKENEEGKTTDGHPDKPDSGIQPSDSTEPGANAPQDQRTLKEEKGSGGTQSGGRSSKENEERKSTDGQLDKPDSGIQPSDNTEPDLDPSFPCKSGTPSRDDILRIADELGTKWKMLGRVLKVPEPVLEEIEVDNRDLSERRYQVLRRWELMSGSNATYQRLAQALQHHTVGLRKVAEKYCGLHS